LEKYCTGKGGRLGLGPEYHHNNSHGLLSETWAKLIGNEAVIGGDIE
jgi:hypothetical protein